MISVFLQKPESTSTIHHQPTFENGLHAKKLLQKHDDASNCNTNYQQQQHLSKIDDQKVPIIHDNVTTITTNAREVRIWIVIMVKYSQESMPIRWVTVGKRNSIMQIFRYKYWSSWKFAYFYVNLNHGSKVMYILKFFLSQCGCWLLFTKIFATFVTCWFLWVVQ